MLGITSMEISNRAKMFYIGNAPEIDEDTTSQTDCLMEFLNWTELAGEEKSHWCLKNKSFLISSC